MLDKMADEGDAVRMLTGDRWRYTEPVPGWANDDPAPWMDDDRHTSADYMGGGP